MTATAYAAAPHHAPLPPRQPARIPALEPRLNKYIPNVPTIKQHATLLLDHIPELLYGGAAGGGKTDLLLMAALQYIDVPGYAAAIFRRTYAQLSTPGQLLERAMEWLEGTDAVGAERMNGQPTRWDFPGKSVLLFRHMQHEQDKENQQGAAYHFAGFDELGQFSKGQYTYVAYSRSRRIEGFPVPLRTRATANPGALWVKEHFRIPDKVDPARMIYVHRYEEQIDGVEIRRDRAFVPAKLDDNPHLDRADYIASLSQLDPVTRAQLLRGDWSVRPTGGYFKREWFVPVESLATIHPSNIQASVRYWDCAATKAKPGKDPDWTVGTLMHLLKDKRVVVADVVRFRESPHETRKRILACAVADGTKIPIRMEEEPGSSGKTVIDSYSRELIGHNFKGIRSTGSKAERASPLSSYAEAGNVLVVLGSWFPDWIVAMEGFTGKDGDHDDDTDSASGAYAFLAKGGVTWSSLYGEAA